MKDTKSVDTKRVRWYDDFSRGRGGVMMDKEKVAEALVKIRGKRSQEEMASYTTKDLVKMSDGILHKT